MTPYVLLFLPALEDQTRRFGHVQPVSNGFMPAEAGERAGRAGVGTQVAQGVHGMSTGPEWQRGQGGKK